MENTLVLEKPTKLKISEEDYNDLANAILPIHRSNPDAYRKYKNEGLSDMRYNWDILWSSKFPLKRLNSYLDDRHIDSALAAILGNSGKGTGRP